MDESARTWFLDRVRYLLIISGTVTAMCLLGTRVHWSLPIISAIPVYVVTFCLVDFLTLPLYFLTPEHRVVSVALNAIEEDNFDTALRVLEAYEKSRTGELQGSQHAGPIEVDGKQNEFVKVQDGDPLEDGVRDLLERCDELTDSVEEIMHHDSLGPQERERLLHKNKAELGSSLPPNSD
ncbi:MAG: hypothetical protein U9Q07_10485 [Planctomycetota bacterium]|nr:hypothetical protein [Planctomycetota bacterium]